MMHDPRHLRRIGWGLLLLGALAAATGAGWRGAGGPNASYLLDTLGWLLAVLGAAADARVGALLIGFMPDRERRRALARLALGIVVFLGGCVALSALGSGRAVARALAGAGLAGGFGLALSGVLVIAWHYGGDYAAGRIDRLNDEEW